MSEGLEYIRSDGAVFTAADIQPGLYPQVSNLAYHKGPGISKSHFDDVAAPNCPAHYWEVRLNPAHAEKPKTPALVLGDAIHNAILLPDFFHSSFMTVPKGAPKRPSTTQLEAKRPSLDTQDAISWWAEFERENAGKVVLNAEDFATVLGARDSVHTHPVARKLLTGGNAEQAFYAIDPETGALIKCKSDYETLERDGRLIDVKTAEDASPDGFQRSVRTYRYDVQDPWYRHVVHRAFGAQDREIVTSFVFVAVEKVPPYCVGVYWLQPEDQAAGMILARRDLRTILDCAATGLWPDYGCDPQPLRRINRRLEGL